MGRLARCLHPAAAVAPRRTLEASMTVSVFDLFTIGIGPSSSHTVGPMRAALRFARRLAREGVQERTERVSAHLYGSLGATGKGHGSDRAVVLGLQGETPEAVDPTGVDARMAALRESGRLTLAGGREVAFDLPEDCVFHRRESLAGHPNSMRMEARDAGGAVLLSAVYHSVGGGFVVEPGPDGMPVVVSDPTPVPHPFSTGAELLARTRQTGLPVSGVMLANELVWRDAAEVRAGLLRIWAAMEECVRNGCEGVGTLPGGLKVQKRAGALHAALVSGEGGDDPLRVMDWVQLWALAVNEENAAGHRVVTAPTNGAAGIIPAVLHHATRHLQGVGDEEVVRFLLTAGAIGLLYKERGSISGAEVGCQGEVGVACSMAAAALCQVMGGTPEQVENAAEIGMEHNLGLTCDPIGGLVQVPCIERNAIAAVKAIAAARMALRGDGTHFVSLDKVIATMRRTGEDMQSKYKETSRGGLAVNVIEC